MLSAIILAAGKGKRFAGKTPKVIAKINSKPAIYYSLNAFNKHPDIGEIIVVANRQNIKTITGIIRRYNIGKAKKIILGGKERRDSVFKGINSLNPETKFVLIHDGARPLIQKKVISSVINAAEKYQAAITAVPVRFTVKRSASGFWVKDTVDRKTLWEVQTPQVFAKELILKAYQKSKGLEATDDSMLVERLGVKVKLVLGSYSNIKLTNLEDLVIASGLIKKCRYA